MTKAKSQPSISIIMPVLNEAEHIEKHLLLLQPYRNQGCELVVVDGGSCDDTAVIATPWVDVCVQADKGRATQMNRGAAQASGQYCLFLHADTQLPADCLQPIMASDALWGFFKVALSQPTGLLRCVQLMMNLRSKLTSVATGDQALFVRRDVFMAQGGFPAIALMEDVALSKRLRKCAKPLIISRPVVTSSRRWQKNGVLKTVLLMWLLRLGYFLNVSPNRLHRAYYG